MSQWNFIIWEKNKKEQEKRPYMQIPLPIPPEPPKNPVNGEKDKQKRGVYIFEM